MATTTLPTDPTQTDPNGLLSTTTQAPPPPVAPTSPVSTYNTPGGTDTVEGRVTGLINHNNDFMKSMETKGKQYVNDRGLLNSSMGAGAAQTAAMDAVLPIAQQDADWENKNRMQADTMAHERSMETYTQQMLAWDQFLKGVADINMQDIDQVSKDRAVQNLRDSYYAGSGIAASLQGVTVQDGQVTYQDVPASTTDQASTAQPATPQPTTTEMTPQAIATGIRDWAGEQFATQLSDGPPAAAYTQSDNGRDYYDTSYQSRYTGQWFANAGAARQYDALLAERLNIQGIPTATVSDINAVRQLYGLREWRNN